MIDESTEIDKDAVKADLFKQLEELSNTPDGEMDGSVSGTQTLDEQCAVYIDKKRNAYIERVKDANTGEYVTKDISNFILISKRTSLSTDQDVPTILRQAWFITSDGSRRVVTVDKGAFASLAKFKEWVQTQANAAFWGSPMSLVQVQMMTFPADMPTVREKNIIGYDHETGHWISGNCGVSNEGEICLPNDEGLITMGGVTYGVAESRFHQRDAVQTWDYKFDGDSLALFRSCVDDSKLLWGEKTEIAWGWAIAHIFRTKYFQRITAFPLLSMTSRAGSGKSQLARLLSTLFGSPIEREPNNLSTLTRVNYFTQMNALCNIPAWMDEVHKVKRPDQLNLLHSNFDGTGSGGGTLDVFVTKERKQRTGVITTGEFMPGDTAYMTRMVQVELAYNRDPEVYDSLIERSKHLSAFFLRIITQYEDMWKLYWDVFLRCKKQLSEAASDSRSVNNYAAAIAGLEMFMPDEGRVARFAGYMAARAADTKDTMIIASMLDKLPYMIHEKGCRISYTSVKKSMRFVVSRTMADHFFALFGQKGDELKRADLLRSARDSGLLIPDYPEKKYAQYKLKTTDQNGNARVATMDVLIFDMNIPRVMDVVMALGEGSANVKTQGEAVEEDPKDFPLC